MEKEKGTIQLQQKKRGEGGGMQRLSGYFPQTSRSTCPPTADKVLREGKEEGTERLDGTATKKDGKSIDEERRGQGWKSCILYEANSKYARFYSKVQRLLMQKKEFD